MSETGRRPLRFGIMCDGSTLHAFQARVLNSLADSHVAQPVALIVDASASGLAKEGLVRKILSRDALWRVFSRLDRPAALARAALPESLAALPALSCKTTREGWSEYFTDDDVAAIRAFDLDFILRFGFGIIRGAILDSARHGVWSFHHGDEMMYRGGPPGFWEIYDGADISGAILQRLVDRLDGGIVLRRGYFKTLDYSYSRNLNRLLFESADWPALVAAELYNGSDFTHLATSRTRAPIRRVPTNMQMVRFLPRLAKNVARRAFERATREEWNVGIARLSAAEIVAGGKPKDVQWVPPVAGGWVADPIAYADNGQVHVLCERMRLKESRGHIATLTYDGSHWTPERLAIEAGCHAAYPYVFDFQGAIYCVPETSEANEIRLFRAVRFPDTWERAGTLVRGLPAVDNTIFKYGATWWLFFTLAHSSDDRLYAYFADSPLGNWSPHTRNPIKIDVRSSRPAGTPFWFNGSLYRPAQDSSKTYGGRVAVNRIVQLTPSTFEEQTVSHLEPAPGRYDRALHTLSRAGDYWVIDGKRRVMRGIA